MTPGGWAAGEDGAPPVTDDLRRAPSLAEQPLSIAIERRDGQTDRVVVVGEIDLATAPQLEGALVGLVSAAVPPRQVVVDMAGLRFIDAVGIRVLIRVRNTAVAAGIGFATHHARGIVWRVIEILELTEVLNATPAPPASGLFALNERDLPRVSVRGNGARHRPPGP